MFFMDHQALLYLLINKLVINQCQNWEGLDSQRKLEPK
jgi:hypothetical protein